jgi:Protein of unknown function (DUF2384)
LEYIDFMSSTMTKAAPGTAELIALHDRLAKEAARIEHLLHEVEQALSGAQVSKSAWAKKDTDSLAPRPSPLDSIKQVLDATADLRTRDGNISADRVAALYGVSLSQLANWLGKSRQAVTKTPDADSLQSALAHFERVARLRAVVKTDDAFRKWLRTNSDLLDGKSPVALMAKGEGQVVADLVDDMLTGAPA